MPSARGLLHAENWEYADGALHIPMDTICEKHFETALRHLEARIRRETGRSCPVHAVPLEQTDGGPVQENEQERAELLHKAVEKAASEAQSEPKPKKPARQIRSEGQAYQRPKTEKVREDDLVFGKLIQDPIVSVNEAVSAYDMVTIQGEVFFTEPPRYPQQKDRQGLCEDRVRHHRPHEFRARLQIPCG